MNFTVEAQSAVKKKVSIEIPQADVAKELDSAYRELKKNAKVKGFRPGKTPRNVLERLYGKEVRADVSSRLIQEAFLEVLKDSEMNVVGMPQIDPPELRADGPYAFDAVVEVRPELENLKIGGFKLKKTLYRPTEEELEAQIQMLRKNLAKMEPVEDDRAAAAGDVVLVDYEGSKDGQPFTETQKTTDFSMKIGDGLIHKDFDDQVVGMKSGDEKTFNVTFPGDYYNDKLAGLEIAFDVTLKEIRQEVLPEIDDAMAKRLGKFESLDELRKQIEENLSKGYAKRQEQELHEQVFTALLDQQTFEVPDAMVAHELESIVSEAQQSFSYHNTSMEELGLTKEALEEKYRDTAVKQVRRHLLLGKIIEQENMELSDEDLEKGYADMAASFNQPVDMIKQFYAQHPDRVDIFKHTLLEKQAINLIIEKSEIEEVEPELEKPVEDTPEG
ncbi:MAG: trigger factor [Desulfobacterales bacterium]|nr:trigger factor [Desulfobacterales bacterium]